MIEIRDLEYFDRGKIENEKFWRRFGYQPDFKDRTILDFGCGHGSLCVDLAKNGARSVNGIDLEDKLLNFANENLKKNYSQFVSKIEFTKKDYRKNCKLGKSTNLLYFDSNFERSKLSPQIELYLKEGEGNNLHERYKCRINND